MAWFETVRIDGNAPEWSADSKPPNGNGYGGGAAIPLASNEEFDRSFVAWKNPRRVHLGAHYPNADAVSRWKFDEIWIGTSGYGSSDLFHSDFSSGAGLDLSNANGVVSVTGGELVVNAGAGVEGYAAIALPDGIDDLYVRVKVKFAAADVTGTVAPANAFTGQGLFYGFRKTAPGTAIESYTGPPYEPASAERSSASIIEITGTDPDNDYISDVAVMAEDREWWYGPWVIPVFPYNNEDQWVYATAAAYYLVWRGQIYDIDNNCGPALGDTYQTIDIRIHREADSIIGPGTTPNDPPAVYAKGFRWICGQAQNDTVLKNPEIDPAWKAAGFYVGVWGVTYHPDNFARDGAALVAQAVAVDADFLIIDAEFCLYNSDPTALINALSAFSGPKALTTFGAASNGFVLPIDYQKFLDAGYYIFPQAYYSATSTADGQSADYLPALCIAHCNRAHVPLDKVNLMIDMCSTGHPDADTQVSLLTDASKRTAFSVFLTECCTIGDLETLGDVSSPETPFSFMTPGLITDNGGGISPGPGQSGSDPPGFPPDGEGPGEYDGIGGGAGGTGGTGGGSLTPVGGEDGGIGVFGYWNPDTNGPSGSTPQQGGIYLIDHSADPDFPPGEFITFRPEECEWDDMIRGTGNISYQISADQRNEQSGALVFSGPDFIGPMRSYYRLRYGSIVIMAGVITNTDVPLGMDYMSVSGKTWEHFLERWQYPFDPRAEPSWPGHQSDFKFPKTFLNDENTATGNDTPTGLVYQSYQRDVIRILRDIFDRVMNDVDNRVLFGINNLDGLSGIKTNYQLSLGDTSYLDSIINGLAETGNGFDWWISYDKKFMWASPYRFGDPGAPSLAFTFDDTHLPDDLHFNNAGPGATHVLGTGAGLASQNRLGRAYGYGPAQTQFSRFDRSYDFGDVRNINQLIVRTQKRLSKDLQPQHNFPLQIDPYRISNFWSTLRKGRAIYVDVHLPHVDVVMHHIDSGQQLKSYKAKLDDMGNCVVDFDLDQIYDLSINAGSPEG